MTTYPGALDNDQTIIRIDDNLSELGTEAINQARDAIFSIESTLGVNPQGSMSSVASRLDESINANGTIKASALSSVGLLTGPLVDSQVASNAGIKESKLDLDYSTVDLNARLDGYGVLITSLQSLASTTDADLNLHIVGAATLSDGSTNARHISNQVDLGFTILDKDGVVRPATTVATAVQTINADLVAHETSIADEHVATAITVDNSAFTTIPDTATNVQEAIEALDAANELIIGQHQANLHTNGISRSARSYSTDGYSKNIIPVTPVTAFLGYAGSTIPDDNNATGDDVISFVPANNSTFVFDALFSQVRVGDNLRINYGNGISSIFKIESVRFTPGSDWVVRVNGINLCESDGYASARIDRTLFDDSKYGVFAVAAANNDLDSTIVSTAIIADPRGACALGIGFDPTQLDSNHYNLYLALYPNGNPADKTINLPAIDVTGNRGITPGNYTLQSVVLATNNALRASGYNYRFIAFEHEGEFGIMLSDSIGSPSFSIINGSISGSSLVAGIYSLNVIDDVTAGNGKYDALGFGALKSGIASPVYTASYASAAVAVSYPTVTIPTLKNRNATVNGISYDKFLEGFSGTYQAFDGYISAITNVPGSTVKVSYFINQDLRAYNLFEGKTILVQPETELAGNDYDYGRFIIDTVSFSAPCGSTAATTIQVLNGIHGTGSATGTTGAVGTNVKLYFNEGSVGFSALNMVDFIPGDFIRYSEVLIDDGGIAYTHERARVPVQAETASLIDTNRWRILEVSPKLKGFTSATEFKNQVQFVLSTYDNTTGEFTGFLRRSSGSTDYGPTIIGKKNVPFRVYDNSYTDYVELMYEEEVSNPGSAIMSTSATRYFTIDIFQDASYDGEVFRLAGVTHKTTEIVYIKDLREFGNVSEQNLTNSALRFIESGNRWLSANGVLQGFEYRDFVSSTRTLVFSGGMALVNGHISILNQQRVTIPASYETASSDTIEWAVCVNDKDTMEVIRLAPSKDQFFARITSSLVDWFQPCVTFDELVGNRRDLTPIAIVSAAANDVTIDTNDIIDVRRIITTQTEFLPLTLVAADSGYVGNFTTLPAITKYLEKSNGPGAVIVNGDIVQAGVWRIDVGAGKKVVIDGQGRGSITAGGITITSGAVEFRNITLETTSSSINVNSDGVKFIGCTLVNNRDVGSYSTPVFYPDGMIEIAFSISNLEIVDCTFSSTIQYRGSFICGFAANSVLQGITIRNCKFNDTLATTKAAIAFTATNQISILRNVFIENNVCNGEQGIYICGDGTFSYVNVINSHITGNKCGPIGYYTGTYSNQDLLEISGNTCTCIYGSDKDGEGIASVSSVTSTPGNVIISGNMCNAIAFINGKGSALDGSAIISRNIVKYDSFWTTPPNVVRTTAIHTAANTAASDMTVKIVGNIISGSYGGTYTNGIYTSTNTGGTGISIERNEVSDFSSYGIVVSKADVTGNSLDRRGTDVLQYIFTTGASYIKDNSFDGYTINAAGDYATIEQTAIPSVGYCNRNEVKTLSFGVGSGGTGESQYGVPGYFIHTQSSGGSLLAFISDTLPPGINVTGVNYGDHGMYTVQHDLTSPAESNLIVHCIPLVELLPINCRILSVTVTVTSSSKPSLTGLITVGCGTQGSYTSTIDRGTAQININSLSSYVPGTDISATVEVPPSFNYVNSRQNPYLYISYNIASTSASLITARQLELTYVC